MLCKYSRLTPGNVWRQGDLAAIDTETVDGALTVKARFCEASAAAAAVKHNVAAYAD